MSDDELYERIRKDARKLRYEGTPELHDRIARGVRLRIAQQESVVELLARWFRPLAATLAALGLVAAVTLERAQQSEVESLLAASDAAPMSEDYYRVAE